jgi:DNA topoisomerase VI subunit B
MPDSATKSKISGDGHAEAALRLAAPVPASRRLHRETFVTSRLLEFFSQKELTTQTGHDPAAWPLVAAKELLDNGLDECEEAGVPPEIAVRVNADGITVTDNGRGIPPATVEAILDFGVRVSSREGYVSPTRGAQGNALKTLFAMPFVLDGKQGRVDITARGVRHEIAVRADPIRQKPLIERQEHKDRLVRNGTVVTVHWPEQSRLLLQHAGARILQIAGDYTFLNPHLTLSVESFDRRARWKATTPTWARWLPSDPTCPHWYTQERLERLIAAYLALDLDRGRERTLREFVATFRGLTASAKQKTVLGQTGLPRVGLSALRNGEGLDHGRVATLLAAMKEHSREVKPAALGVIGKDHLAARIRDLGGDMDTFGYKKATGQDDGLPWVAETAFAAWCDESQSRRLVSGVNFSPGIINPFRQLGRCGVSLDTILEQQRCSHKEPVVLVLHLTCPRVDYTDRGKSAVVIGGTDQEEDE